MIHGQKNIKLELIKTVKCILLVFVKKMCHDARSTERRKRKKKDVLGNARCILGNMDTWVSKPNSLLSIHKNNVGF